MTRNHRQFAEGVKWSVRCGADQQGSTVVESGRDSIEVGWRIPGELRLLGER